MLETRNLCKSFGAIPVTRHVSLTLERGERRVLLGPNGAGKTTLFHQLAGELKPDSGSIHLAGQDITRLGVAARARRGLARSYQRNTLFDDLTVAENLGLAAAIALGHARALHRSALARPEVRETVAEVAARTGLAALLDRRVSAISYGFRRQLEVALALATRPAVILMDEPSSGVGPEQAKSLHGLLLGLPRDLTLLIVEHDMDLAFAVADSVTVLNQGEVVFDGPPDAARASPLLREIYLGSWADA
ncbi:MAG: ATP-binding cassette domain-containing protein [Alphaproteobacteria bacterium]|nr:ATP-binding cassette domain-containing protein [Alphaproteobacteria bacterium]